MRKKTIAVIIVVTTIVVGFIIFYCGKNNKNRKEEFAGEAVTVNKDSIEYNGWLKTKDGQLVNEKEEAIQLRGLSSHGIQWFSDVITRENLQELKEQWNINVFRVAMYTEINNDGYVANKEQVKQKLFNAVDIAKDLDLYVIVDWHILKDNNPQIHQNEAIDFFDEVSTKYANVPNILYEICNEPNGNDVSWDNNVKPYADIVIKTIRTNSPKSVIIVGTPDWSKDLKSAADNPLNYDNILYSCHFYAGANGVYIKESIDYCVDKKIPVFVSECGITNETGDGDIYENEFKEWIDFLNKRNISWIFWSFCNKDEGSSILDKNYKVSDEPEEQVSNSIDENLSNTGKIMKEIFKSYKK